MTLNEATEEAEKLLAQLYDPISGKKKALSAKKYERIYEKYRDLEEVYQYNLGEEMQPEYGGDELTDLLEDICGALA